VRAYRCEAVYRVGRDFHEITLPNLMLLTIDDHSAAATDYVIEFERWMLAPGR
jgi:hypothetical protein